MHNFTIRRFRVCEGKGESHHRFQVELCGSRVMLAVPKWPPGSSARKLCVPYRYFSGQQAAEILFCDNNMVISRDTPGRHSQITWATFLDGVCCLLFHQQTQTCGCLLAREFSRTHNTPTKLHQYWVPHHTVMVEELSWLVGLYGISTLVGCLMPNHLYTYLYQLYGL